MQEPMMDIITIRAVDFNVLREEVSIDEDSWPGVWPRYQVGELDIAVYSMDDILFWQRLGEETECSKLYSGVYGCCYKEITSNELDIIKNKVQRSFCQNYMSHGYHLMI